MTTPRIEVLTNMAHAFMIAPHPVTLTGDARRAIPHLMAYALAMIQSDGEPEPDSNTAIGFGILEKILVVMTD